MTDIDLLSEPAVHRSALAAREFVHRLAPSQVLLTQVRPAGHDEYRAVVHWPRATPAHDARAARHKPDPLMVAETLRQLGVFLPLRYYGVDPASRLVIEELSFTLDSAAEPNDHPTGTEITCAAQVRRAGAAASGPPHSLELSVEFSAQNGNTPFARADGTARVLSLAAYRAVRNRRKRVREETEAEAGPDPASRGEPVAHDRVGAFGPHEVLVALDEKGAIRIAPADPHHPFFHDHPSDHITGVTLISAVRQAAALQRGEPELRMISCALKATRFTEPDPPATIEVDESGRFEIRQEGTVTAVGEAGFEDAEDAGIGGDIEDAGKAGDAGAVEA